MTDDTAYDPCAVYASLKDALNKVTAGETVRKVRFRSGEDEREVDFAPANVADLRRAMIQAREECSKSISGTGTRFAMSGHQRPSPCFGGYRRFY